MARTLQDKIHERCTPQATARRRIAAADEAACSVNDTGTAETARWLVHACVGVIEISGVAERRRLLFDLGTTPRIARAMPDVMTRAVCVLADVMRMTRCAVLGSC
jgi:hypothetical protein